MNNGYDELGANARQLEIGQQIQLTSVGVVLWHTVGVMALDGRLTLDETKRLTETLVVWASYERNKGNKTWTARELNKSRRVIRGIIRRWESLGGDTNSLSAALRELVAEPIPNPGVAAPVEPPVIASVEPPEQFIDTEALDTGEGQGEGQGEGRSSP